jgi:hypothetical protein
LKLGKLFVAELAIVIIVLVVIVVVVEVNPTLAASKHSAPIGTYNTKEYAADTVTINKGDAFGAAFEYSSYEPAILVINVKFTDIQTPGYIGFSANGRYIGSIYASPDNPQTSISAISIAGSEWVKPPSAYSSAFSNEVIFSSDSNNGFAGTFDYQINLKGSR